MTPETFLALWFAALLALAVLAGGLAALVQDEYHAGSRRRPSRRAYRGRHWSPAGDPGWWA